MATAMTASLNAIVRSRSNQRSSKVLVCGTVSGWVQQERLDP